MIIDYISRDESKIHRFWNELFNILKPYVIRLCQSDDLISLVHDDPRNF